MANWFRRTTRNGLTITQSTKGTTWSKSTKGGSVRHTVTHKPDGKIVQTTTQRAGNGWTKIEKKVVNKKPPKMPKVPKPKKIRKPPKVRYRKTRGGNLSMRFTVWSVKWSLIIIFILILLSKLG